MDDFSYRRASKNEMRTAGVRNYAFIRSEKNNRLNRHQGGRCGADKSAKALFPLYYRATSFPYIRQPSAFRPQDRAAPAALCRTFYVWSTPAIHTPPPGLVDLTPVTPVRTVTPTRSSLFLSLSSRWLSLPFSVFDPRKLSFLSPFPRGECKKFRERERERFLYFEEKYLQRRETIGKWMRIKSMIDAWRWKFEFFRVMSSF